MADKKISDLTAITGANTADDDLLVIVDTSAGETKRITLGELENGLARSNFALGDNEKITFGAGSDLQIYHDGSNSYVTDAGTGALRLRGASQVQIGDTNGELFFLGNQNASVALYYDNAAKLATTSTGIDVTGTVTADGLTVDGDATIGGTSGGKLSIEGQGINAFATTTEPSIYRTGSGGSDIFGAAGHLVIQPRTSAARSVNIATSANGTTTLKRASFEDNGDISFYEDTGTTPKFFWDASAESLGIGTSSLTTNTIINELHIDAPYGDGVSRLRLSSSVENMEGSIAISGYQGSDSMVFAIGSGGDGSAAERMRIDSSGQVGIGTSSPSYKLHVAGVVNSEVSSGDARYRFKTGTKGGWLGIPSWNNDALYLYAPTTTASEQHVMSYNGAVTDGFVFNTGATPTERMRIDSSGNLLVGTTSAGWSNTLSTTIEPYYIIKNHTSGTASGTLYVGFGYNSSGIGSIVQSGTTSVAYNTTSDYRLKTDVQPMTGATERLKALKPVNFEWIADGTRVDGFLAHEAQEVVPEAVTGTKDAVDADGNPEYQGIDQSKLTPLLTAALKDTIAMVEELQAEVSALKAQLNG
jgi:hypothetical protein